MKQLFSTLLITSSLCAAPLYANDKSVYQVGIVGIWDSEVYEEEDDDLMVLPWLYLRSGPWEFERTALKYYVVDNDNFTLAPRLSLELDGYEADDSPVLRGMEDRDFSVGLGFEASSEWQFLDFGLAVWRDIADNSDGVVAELSVSVDHEVSPRLRLGAGLGVDYYNSDFSNYYYGVLPTETTANRPAYEPGSTLNPNAQLTAFYQLNQNWTLAAILQRTQFDSALEDSPIVSNSGETSFILGVAYQGFF